MVNRKTQIIFTIFPAIQKSCFCCPKVVNKYSFKSNIHSNEHSFRNERIFVQSFRTNIRIFGIFVQP